MFELAPSEDLHRLTDSALAGDLVEIRRRIDLLEAAFARRLAVFDRRQGYLSDGAVTMVSCLRRRCRLTIGAASKRPGTARRLGDLPSTEGPFRDGEIG